MIRALDYLFIGLYRLFLKTSDKDIAEFSAVVFFSIGLISYSAIILNLLIPDIAKYFPIKSFSYAFTAIVMITNYFIYMKSGRYKRIYEKRLNETKTAQMVSLIVSAGFVVGGLLSVIIYKILTT
jgi:hypothetical protein